MLNERELALISYCARYSDNATVVQKVRDDPRFWCNYEGHRIPLLGDTYVLQSVEQIRLAMEGQYD
jgi:hypothetical protein